MAMGEARLQDEEERTRLMEEINKRAFAAMDVDNSGCISASELRPLMSAVAGTKMTQQQADDVLSIAAGSDGKVRYEDFVRAIKP